MPKQCLKRACLLIDNFIYGNFNILTSLLDIYGDSPPDKKLVNRKRIYLQDSNILRRAEIEAASSQRTY
jgi:hypothetical protein